MRNDPCIQIIQEKPITLRWKKENEKNHEVPVESRNDQRNTNPQSIDSFYEESENQKTHKINNEIQNPIVQECDVCDLCDAHEDYNIQSKEITTINTDNVILKDAKISNNNRINDNIKNKLISSSIDKTDKNNQTKETIEVITDKEKGKNHDKELPNITEQSSSHSSHSSHSASENPSNKRVAENIKIDSRNLQEDDSHPQLEPQLQLKHSPNADIFTNESIQNIKDSKKLQSTEDICFTSNSNTEGEYL